ncbi:DNA-binding response regulator [[Clostridium] symbiosum]|uniref:DNA-binding response regulator n=1 Tax=Clostridium symbiosum TaxID=1512 RepID=UPI0025703273|nr:DNA-binding response regulator [[Clostridium] symbiosum]
MESVKILLIEDDPDIREGVRVLLESEGYRIVEAENIYESVWQEPFFYGSSNTVMVHIRKLRMKIEKNPQRPEHISTVWGKGYRFD